jgi:hypothetical protein
MFIYNLFLSLVLSLDTDAALPMPARTGCARSARVWEPEGPQALASTGSTRRAKAGSLAAQTSLQLAHAPAEHEEPIGAALVVHKGCQGFF